MRAIKFVVLGSIGLASFAWVMAHAWHVWEARQKRLQVERDCPVGTWIWDGVAEHEAVYVCESVTMAVSESDQGSVLDDDLRSMSKLGVVPAEPRPMPQIAEYFNGYACKSDCSGYKAGYVWAEDNEIEDQDGCEGKSQSFIDGCMAYVDAYQTELGEDAAIDLTDPDDCPSDNDVAYEACRLVIDNR
jgi:hypothetical protein